MVFMEVPSSQSNSKLGNACKWLVTGHKRVSIFTPLANGNETNRVYILAKAIGLFAKFLFQAVSTILQGLYFSCLLRSRKAKEKGLETLHNIKQAPFLIVMIFFGIFNKNIYKHFKTTADSNLSMEKNPSSIGSLSNLEQDIARLETVSDPGLDTKIEKSHPFPRCESAGDLDLSTTSSNEKPYPENNKDENKDDWHPFGSKIKGPLGPFKHLEKNDLKPGAKNLNFSDSNKEPYPKNNEKGFQPFGSEIGRMVQKGPFQNLGDSFILFDSQFKPIDPSNPNSSHESGFFSVAPQKSNSTISIYDKEMDPEDLEEMQEIEEAQKKAIVNLLRGDKRLHSEVIFRWADYLLTKYGENIDIFLEKMRGESFQPSDIRNKIEQAKTDGKKKIFLPIVLESKWKDLLPVFAIDHIVLVMFDLEKNTICYYDSQGGDLEKEGRAFRWGSNEKVNTFFKELKGALNWPIHSFEEGHQGTFDFRNCGAFVCHAMNKLCEQPFEDFCKQKTNIGDIRKQIANTFADFFNLGEYEEPEILRPLLQEDGKQYKELLHEYLDPIKETRYDEIAASINTYEGKKDKKGAILQQVAYDLERQGNLFTYEYDQKMYEKGGAKDLLLALSEKIGEKEALNVMALFNQTGLAALEEAIYESLFPVLNANTMPPYMLLSSGDKTHFTLSIENGKAIMNIKTKRDLYYNNGVSEKQKQASIEGTINMKFLKGHKKGTTNIEWKVTEIC